MPYLQKELFSTVLDMGCGIGKGISRLRKLGFEAYGIDLPDLSPFWSKYGNDPKAFFAVMPISFPSVTIILMLYTLSE